MVVGNETPRDRIQIRKRFVRDPPRSPQRNHESLNDDVVRRSRADPPPRIVEDEARVLTPDALQQFFIHNIAYVATGEIATWLSVVPDSRSHRCWVHA
jgi:hypothetical protein